MHACREEHEKLLSLPYTRTVTAELYEVDARGAPELTMCLWPVSRPSLRRSNAVADYSLDHSTSRLSVTKESKLSFSFNHKI